MTSILTRWLPILAGLLLATIYPEALLAMPRNDNTSFDVQYIPLDAEFYVPPTRADIWKSGVRIASDSAALTGLFAAIANQKGLLPRPMDWKALRVLIVRKSDGREVFITSGRRILSGSRAFEIDQGITDLVIDEIEKQVNNAK
jgi:hypothetical protein